MICRNDRDASEWDFVQGSADVGTFLIRALAYPVGFVDLPFTCQDTTAALPVTAEFRLNDAPLPTPMTNETQCQKPIDGYAADWQATETVQLEEWGDELYVKVNEKVALYQNTSQVSIRLRVNGPIMRKYLREIQCTSRPTGPTAP